MYEKVNIRDIGQAPYILVKTLLSTRVQAWFVCRFAWKLAEVSARGNYERLKQLTFTFHPIKQLR